MRTNYRWQPPDLPTWDWTVLSNHHKAIPETRDSPGEPAYVEVYSVRPVALPADLVVAIANAAATAEQTNCRCVAEWLRKLAKGPTDDDRETLKERLNNAVPWDDDDYDEFREQLKEPA